MERLKNAWELLAEKLQGWLDSAVLMLPNLLLALIFFALVVFISRRLRNITYRLLERISDNGAVNRLISAILAILFVTLGMFVALSIMNLDKAVTSLLAGAGVAGLAIGLAFQEPLINTLSGIIMSVDKPFQLNDLVETNGFMGTISNITLRSTHVKLMSGEKVVIPNKLVVQNPFTNYTINGERRVDLTCGISYGEDLDKVKRVALEAVQRRVNYNKSRPVEFFYTGFGSSSIDFIIRFWLDLCNQSDYLKARDEAVIALKQAFDAEGITIPFPIRTLDFGIKGGLQLGRVLESANGPGLADNLKTNT